jgi:hypothetical protein
MYNTLNKQTSFFLALSLILVLFSTCRKGSSKYKSANAPKIQWQKTISNTNQAIIYNAQQTTDGGYILAGYKEYTLNNGNYWIAKLNSNADIEWEKIYGSADFNKSINIQQTINNGYIVAYFITDNNYNINSWILKLTPSGDIEWKKSYVGSSDNILNSIKQTADKGYIAVGQTRSNNGDIPNDQRNFDAWIIKLAANGNLEWTKTFGGAYHEEMNDVQQTTNGEYLIVGQTESSDGDITNNHGHADLWVLKLQANGNLAWQKTYGGSNFDNANCIQKTNDGHYIIAGGTESNDGDITNSHGDEDAWVIKIDDLGTILQQITVGTNDSEVANSILQTHDNNFLIAGYSLIIDSGIDNIFIAALDTNCNLLWKRQIHQENNDTFADFIFETPDYCYIIFGEQFFENGLSTPIIIKLK